MYFRTLLNCLKCSTEVFRPILLVLFVNDIPEVANATVKLYAEDTTIVGNHKVSRSLQQDVGQMEEWSHKGLLKFNELNCKVMCFGRNTHKHSCV